MRKARMTESEYKEAKKEIEQIKSEIEWLRERKKTLSDKVRWYEYTEDKLGEEYKKGFCYQHFGKRRKDLTEEEAKEYSRLQAQISRNRMKGSCVSGQSNSD